MPTQGSSPDREAVLRNLEEQMRRLHARTEGAACALGVAEWDWTLAALGRDWLRERGHATGPGPRVAPEAPPVDVYLATQIYDIGGHTALVGDMVRALDSASDGRTGARSHVVVTNLYGQNERTVPAALARRLGVCADRIIVLGGDSRAAILDRLFETLLRIAPDRLFLFHHGHDPLAAVVAQPEVARQCWLVHHADRVPSLGTYCSGVKIIDLFPTAAAMTRLLGRTPALLRLTAPDPGPRTSKFLARGKLVTASSGSSHKFTTPYRVTYADTVAEVLKATVGWHVHIGPLDVGAIHAIHQALDRAGVTRDRFEHVPQVDSVSNALWERQCDVYLASFPIDGARTRVEVLASATPYVRHSTALDAGDGGQPTEGAAGSDSGVWRTWSDLTACLSDLSHAGVLEACSVRVRAEYDRLHHPAVFERTLHAILDGRDGAEDADRARRDEVAAGRLLRALSALPAGQADIMASLAAAQEGLGYVRGQTEHLVDRVAHIPADIDASLERLQHGRGTRARLRRWLLKP